MENNTNVDQQYSEAFTRPIIKLGRATNLGAFFLCFIPAITLYLVWGAFPGVGNIFNGWVLIASIFLLYAVVEPISFYPILGLPGTYMSFLSGNIGNMRVPVSSIAQDVIGTEPGTKQAELVSTLAIAGSIITNLIVTSGAAFGGAALMSVMPAVIIEAFAYVSPAIFGAMFGMYFLKSPKYGVFALILTGTMLFLLSDFLPVFLILLIAVFGTITFAMLTDGKKSKQA